VWDGRGAGGKKKNPPPPRYYKPNLIKPALVSPEGKRKKNKNGLKPLNLLMGIMFLLFTS
jgi:hypothetical protein